MDTEISEKQPQPWSSHDDHSDTNVGAPLSRTKSSAGGYGERDGNAVDYESAMHTYEEMRRELTRQSTIHGKEDDLEKGSPERFDLTDYLSGVDRRQGEEGFQPKHLGLVVKNLTVKVKSALLNNFNHHSID